MKKPILTGVIAAALGIAVVGGTCLATGNCQSKTASMSEMTTYANDVKPQIKEIRWLTSLEAAKEESASTGKPIFVDFHATWCPPCKMMEERTFTDDKVIAESQKWVMLKIDTDEQQDIAIKYRITSLPTLATLQSDGSPIIGADGFMPPQKLIEFLEYAYKEAKKQ